MQLYLLSTTRPNREGRGFTVSSLWFTLQICLTGRL